MEIIFTKTNPNVLDEYSPQPAHRFVPDWYKNLSSYLEDNKKTNGKGETNGTAKRCMPIFDCIAAGYILVTPADVYVSNVNGQPYFEWAGLNLVSFHAKEQAPNHPNRNNMESYPKWINYWSIKTPKGYSTLFVQPMHRESPFTILPGIVDTDAYTIPVNFPFTLNDLNFEGLIPAGTPIAQVIPFKRDDWKMRLGSDKDYIEHQEINKKLHTKIYDRYKTLFRSLKEYK
jgi:hypothetical protein